jgi:hypothetical protein
MMTTNTGTATSEAGLLSIAWRMMLAGFSC